jgi:pilus assembly protein CpaC
MLISALLVTFSLMAGGAGEQSRRVDPEVISLPRGGSELLELPVGFTRVAVGDTTVANIVVVSPREILINGLAIGSTTLIVWDASDAPRTFNIEVSIDVAALERQFAIIFPGEGVEATAFGNMVVLSGTVSSGEVARRMAEIARATGATVIEHIACVRPSVSC